MRALIRGFPAFAFGAIALGMLGAGQGAWAALASGGAQEREIQGELKRLQTERERTRKRLSALGVRVGTGLPEMPSPSGSGGDGSHKKNPPLFTLYESPKTLRAAAGKLLFGATYHRLVVSGEGAHAIVKLDSGQGIFSGYRALGHAHAGGDPDRVEIDFDRLVSRSGQVIPIQGSAWDELGGDGLTAQVFSSKALSALGALAGSFVSGLASSQETLSPTAFGFGEAEPSTRNAVLQGVAQSAADQSKRLLDETTQEKPLLVVEAGTPVTIYLDQEVRF